jgi:hypothetical protein
MSARNVEVPKVTDLRFRSGRRAPTQRELVAASLVLRPDDKEIRVRGDRGRL